MTATTGAVLGGRRGYEVGRSSQRPETSKPFGGRWRGPIFILTHNPPADESDPEYRFISGDIRDAVANALAAADGENLLILGADVAGQCLGAGLVDEVMIFLVPVVLGGGVRLFGSRVRETLKLVDASSAGQVVILRYQGGR